MLNIYLSLFGNKKGIEKQYSVFLSYFCKDYTEFEPSYTDCNSVYSAKIRK